MTVVPAAVVGARWRWLWQQYSCGCWRIWVRAWWWAGVVVMGRSGCQRNDGCGRGLIMMGVGVGWSIPFPSTTMLMIAHRTCSHSQVSLLYLITKATTSHMIHDLPPSRPSQYTYICGNSWILWKQCIKVVMSRLHCENRTESELATSPHYVQSGTDFRGQPPSTPTTFPCSCQKASPLVYFLIRGQRLYFIRLYLVQR